MYRYSYKIARIYWRVKSQTYYRQYLGAIGKRSRIIKPLLLRNIENIFIGDNVTIYHYAWLFTLPLENMNIPKIMIGDGTEIGHFNHITCVDSVSIGSKVLTADRVHISDNNHGYEDTATAIIDQPVVSKGPVSIGDGSWLGENVSVLSCSIGRNCVIGANAVVVNDIPDFCVAVGSPARVIKRFNNKSGKWEKV
jgi:acetyltransferase-like isoleucine patch superfamily enzyme